MTSTLRGGFLRRALLISAFAFTLFATLLSPVSAAAQQMDTTFYGYFNEDMTSAIMLGEIEFDAYGMSGALVSPATTDAFFDSFDIFEDPEISRSLKSSEVTAISAADEYLVYEGTLDFVDGKKPGYVIFISTGGTMFLICGYIADRRDIFALVEETIDAGTSPLVFNDYVRVDLD